MGITSKEIDLKLKKMEDKGLFEKKYDYIAEKKKNANKPNEFLTEQLKNELYFEQYEFMSYRPTVKYVSKFLDSILVKLDKENLNLRDIEDINRYVDREFEDNIFNEKLKEEVNNELVALTALYFAFQEKLMQVKLTDKIKKAILDYQNDDITGYKLNELIEQSKLSSKAKIKAIIKANWSLKEKAYKEELRKASVEKIDRDLNSILLTTAKHLREKTLNEPSLNEDIEGWISIAILDNRTTPICIKLHKEFYSKAIYKDRFNIPNLPPRHIKCRSAVVRTKDYTQDARMADLSFGDFLLENEDIGIDILGQKKYELFKTGRYDIKNFISNENRFFTLKELEDRLN